MTADTITAIKKALEGVTPGPWHAGHLGGEGKCQCRSIVSEGISGAICAIQVNNGKRIGEGGNDAPPLSEAIANMHYIASVNPEAISEILSTLESLLRENEGLREALKPFAQFRTAKMPGKYSDAISEYFVPSDFDKARTALSNTGDTHGN